MFSKQWKNQQYANYTEFIDEPIIFDGFLFPRFPSVFCFADGLPGRRSMFLFLKVFLFFSESGFPAQFVPRIVRAAFRAPG